MDITKYFLLILLIPYNAISQQSSITGKISVHNSETYTGKRKYVSGAQVMDNFQKANPVLSDNYGRFKLIFVGVPEKKTVSFQVIKQGLQVVLQSSLTAISGQIDTVKITMAHPDSITEYLSKIFINGKTKAEKKAEKKIVNLNTEIKTLKADKIKNVKRIEMLESELAETLSQKEKIQEIAEDLASQYAPVNLDDASEIFRKSFLLFQNGDLDSALLLLGRNVDVVGFLKKRKLESDKIAAIKNEVALRESNIEIKTIEFGKTIKLKADLHKANFEFDSTLKSYDQLLQIDSNNYNYNVDYARFLVLLNYNEKAIDCYKRVIRICANISDTILKQSLLARNEHGIGSNFKSIGKVDSAEIHYIKSFNILFSLRISENELAYPYEVAGVINDLSSIYWERSDFKLAEKGFLKAYSIIEPLTMDGNINEEIVLAGISNNLGLFYKSLEDTINAKLYFSKSIAIYRKHKNLPELINHDFVNTLNNLSSMYVEEDSVKAEEYLLEALQLCSEGSKKDKRLFVIERSMVNSNLGRLYHVGNNFKKSEFHYMQSFDAIQPLYKSNPTAFQIEVAKISLGLGMLYKTFGMDSVSFIWLTASLDLYTKNCTKEKCIFEKDRALIFSVLGGLFFKRNEFARSIYYHIKSHESYTKLCNTSPDRYTNERDNELQRIIHIGGLINAIKALFKILTGFTLPNSSTMIQVHSSE